VGTLVVVAAVSRRFPALVKLKGLEAPSSH